MRDSHQWELCMGTHLQAKHIYNITYLTYDFYFDDDE